MSGGLHRLRDASNGSVWKWTAFVAAACSALAVASIPLQARAAEPCKKCGDGSSLTAGPQKCECSRQGDAEGPGYVVLRATNPDTQEQYYFVDEQTYRGWLTYHTFCYICHDDKAEGSVVRRIEGCRTAPNLLAAVRWYKLEYFRSVVIDGVRSACGMPPWNDNPIVRGQYRAIFSYLRARAEGELPTFENGIPPMILPLEQQLPKSGTDAAARR